MIETPGARLVLDALRGGGALVVFVAHAAFFWLDGYETSVPARLLHAADLAVVVFFVVSGIVVVASLQRRADAAPDGRVDLARFARDRAWRLLPPLAVAVAVTAGCHALLVAFGPSGYESYLTARQTLGVALFVQDLIRPFDVPLANGPLWSLAHEGWFYVVGAALFVRRANALSLVAVAVLLLGAGATFGLLPDGVTGPRAGHWLPGFVVWLAGGAIALAAHRAALPSLRHGARAVTTVVSLVVLAATAVADAFGARYAFGLALAALLAASGPSLASMSAASPARHALRPLAAVAPFSYTLYVLHYPLVLVWNVATDSWQRTPMGLAATVSLGLVGTLVLSAIVAHRVETLPIHSNR